jgi:hypothetical protein
MGWECMGMHGNAWECMGMHGNGSLLAETGIGKVWIGRHLSIGIGGGSRLTVEYQMARKREEQEEPDIQWNRTKRRNTQSHQICLKFYSSVTCLLTDTSTCFTSRPSKSYLI